MSQEKETIRQRMERYRVGKLSLGRFSEIQAAEEEGRDIDVTDEERAEYERMKPKLSAHWEGITQAYTESGMMSDDYRRLLEQIKQLGQIYQVKPVTKQHVATQSTVDDEAQVAPINGAIEAQREDYERELETSKNIRDTRDALIGLVNVMQNEHEKTALRDIEARISADKNFRVARKSMIFGGWSMVFALLALVAVVVFKFV
jgi:hypothetical protein